MSAAGAPIGFLFAQPNLTAPDSALSYFSPAFSVGSPLSGHAVAAGHDPGVVYRELFAFLAADLVRDGFLDFGVGVLVSEREVADAVAGLNGGPFTTGGVLNSNVNGATDWWRYWSSTLTLTGPAMWGGTRPRCCWSCSIS